MRPEDAPLSKEEEPLTGKPVWGTNWVASWQTSWGDWGDKPNSTPGQKLRDKDGVPTEARTPIAKAISKRYLKFLTLPAIQVRNIKSFSCLSMNWRTLGGAKQINHLRPNLTKNNNKHMQIRHTGQATFESSARWTSAGTKSIFGSLGLEQGLEFPFWHLDIRTGAEWKAIWFACIWRSTRATKGAPKTYMTTWSHCCNCDFTKKERPCHIATKAPERAKRTTPAPSQCTHSVQATHLHMHNDMRFIPNLSQ